MVEPSSDSRADIIAAETSRELRALGAGVVLGRYTLLRRVAAGGMAEVYAARSQGISGFEKKVAIKKILPQFSMNKRFIDMLVDEAKITVSLTHPNIAQIYELGLEGDTYYIVMEYVDGRPMNRLMQKADAKGFSTIPIEHAVHIMAEVAKGLHHAHNQKDPRGRPLGIVHRDVSPQNILLAYTGDVKLIDFGIARAAGRAAQTSAGVIKGKLRYLAPEIAIGDEPDLRADVYCCGIVLFELLTGEAMYAPRTDAEALEMASAARVRSPRQSNPKIPAELDEIVMMALRRNRDERYQTAKALYTDLRRFLNQYFPAYVGSELGDFMQTLFAADMAEERRLDGLAERIAASAQHEGEETAAVPEGELAGPSPAPRAPTAIPEGDSAGKRPKYKQLVTRAGIDLNAVQNESQRPIGATPRPILARAASNPIAEGEPATVSGESIAIHLKSKSASREIDVPDAVLTVTGESGAPKDDPRRRSESQRARDAAGFDAAELTEKTAWPPPEGLAASLAQRERADTSEMSTASVEEHQRQRSRPTSAKPRAQMDNEATEGTGGGPAPSERPSSTRPRPADAPAEAPGPQSSNEPPAKTEGAPRSTSGPKQQQPERPAFVAADSTTTMDPVDRHSLGSGAQVSVTVHKLDREEKKRSGWLGGAALIGVGIATTLVILQLMTAGSDENPRNGRRENERPVPAGPARVEIRVSPPVPVEVTVDGRIESTGRPPPIALELTPDRPHFLRVSAEGYLPDERSYTPAVGDSVIDVSLLSNSGTIVIKGREDDMEITSDKGRIEGDEIKDIPLGVKFEVRVDVPGAGRILTRELELDSREPVVLTIEPRKPAAKGTVTVNAYPGTSEVLVNDKLRGVTPLVLSLSPGTYKVTLRQDGKSYTFKSVTVKPKKQSQVQYRWPR